MLFIITRMMMIKMRKRTRIIKTMMMLMMMIMKMVNNDVDDDNDYGNEYAFDFGDNATIFGCNISSYLF